MYSSLLGGKAGLFRIPSRPLLRKYAAVKISFDRNTERYCTNFRAGKSRARCTQAGSSALPTFFITTPIYYLNSGRYSS